MAVIGITGGISTGKTSFCECLREIVPAAKFFDADQVAHELVDLDPGVKKEIRREFGNGIFSATGDLNRDRLRAIVFGDAAKKRALERFFIRRFAANGARKRKRIATLPNFSYLIFPFFMKPAVKRCAIEWLWWPVLPKSSYDG